MIYREIPHTDLKFSQICLGTDGLVGRLSEDEIFYLFDHYCDLGGNIFDSALIYAYKPAEHASAIEKVVGKWIASRKNSGKVYFATKGAHYIPLDSKEPRLAKTDIERDLDSSLKSTGLETIDLYWLHRDDPDRPVSDIVQTMVGLQKAGKIRYYGCSNWTAKRIADANEYADSIGSEGFVADQMCWSLAEINLTAHTGYGLVNMDEDLYEMHGKSRMPAMPYSPQAKGFYSKLAESGPEGLSDKIKARYLNENNLRIFERLLTVSQKIGAPVSQVSLAWLMAHEFVTIPVVGCKNKTQLEDCMKSVGLCLDPQVRDFIIGKA